MPSYKFYNSLLQIHLGNLEAISSFYSDYNLNTFRQFCNFVQRNISKLHHILLVFIVNLGHSYINQLYWRVPTIIPVILVCTMFPMISIQTVKENVRKYIWNISRMVSVAPAPTSASQIPTKNYIWRKFDSFLFRGRRLILK